MDNQDINYLFDILREIRNELESIHRLLEAREQRETMFIHYMEGVVPPPQIEEENHA